MLGRFVDDFGTMLGYLLELFWYKNETALTPFQEALKRLLLRLSVALPVSCHSGDGKRLSKLTELTKLRWTFLLSGSWSGLSSLEGGAGGRGVGSELRSAVSG